MTTMKNIELFAEVLSFIKANPDNWNQGMWAEVDSARGFCGCFAGHLMHTFKGVEIGSYIHYCTYLQGVKETFCLTLKEANFLTAVERNIADFEFFLRNKSITNPANGRIEDAEGYNDKGYDASGFAVDGYDANGLDADGYAEYYESKA
jgi:hypothetical protein